MIRADAALDLRIFVRFYLPLVATSYLLTATNPLLAAALARTSDPATALSGYGVAFSLIGVIYAPLLVIQQVAAQRLLSAGDLTPVRRSTAVVAVVLSAVAAIVAPAPVWAPCSGGASPAQPATSIRNAARVGLAALTRPSAACYA